MLARAHNRKLPKQAYQTSVESFSHEGRGVAHVNGKVVFIDGALPGEEVLFVYTDNRRDYAAGKVTEVLVPSKQRIQPKCPHFGVCGGCSLQHLDSAGQNQAKQSFLESQLRRFAKLDSVPFWKPLTGPQWGYRFKARLGVKYVIKKSRVLVGFREKHSNLIADIEQCSVLYPNIGQRLSDLSDLIMSLSIRSRIPQIEVAVGDDVCALVFRILEDITEEDKEKLIEFESSTGLAIYLQRNGPKSVEPLRCETPILLSYSLPEYGLAFHFKPTDFTQINRKMNRMMVEKALQVLEPEIDDCILDLFCGLGNFSLSLARHGCVVVGVEGSEDLVERARHNAQSNGVDNVEFFTSDLTGDITAEPWVRRRYNKLLLDPSRAGAQEVLAHCPSWGVERIVYISCNPATLARDAGILVGELGYRITHAGVMDMFPHTAHIESIALFEK